MSTAFIVGSILFEIDEIAPGQFRWRCEHRSCDRDRIGKNTFPTEDDCKQDAINFAKTLLGDREITEGSSKFK